jgi:hypothetical protein
MNEILESFGIPALRGIAGHVWRDVDDEQLIASVPAPTQTGGTVLVGLKANDELKEAYISAEVLTVAGARRSAILEALNSCNCHPSFVTAMVTQRDDVVAYIFVELTYSDSPQELISLGIKRLLAWIGMHYTELVKAAQPPRRASKLDRQVAEILRKTDQAEP